MAIFVRQKNLHKILETIEACKKLLEEGGDWERKNRLRVSYDILWQWLLSLIRVCSTTGVRRHLLLANPQLEENL